MSLAAAVMKAGTISVAVEHRQEWHIDAQESSETRCSLLVLVVLRHSMLSWSSSCEFSTPDW